MFDFDTESLKKSINSLKNGRVLVIGDFAIDEMIYGDTHRISREAPVLILRHSHTNIILGAAANAAHNVSVLNEGKVTALGVYGNDYQGGILIDTLKNAGIDTSFMVMDETRPTTTKTRISGSSAQSVIQQIVRIDREKCEYVNKNVEKKLIENIIKLMPEHDAVILSDYNIGVITPLVIETTVREAKKHGIVVGVDAQKDLSRFKDVSFITPNQPDTEKEVGYFIKNEENLMRAGRELLGKTNSDMILITRGSEGMRLFEKNGEVYNIPVFNKTEVFDVTGAGDTVVAVFTLAVATGAGPYAAAILGNLAASIVVRHFGCATTSRKEMAEALENLVKDMENMEIDNG